MTKTLTEQWRERTLESGVYYVLLTDNGSAIVFCEDGSLYDDPYEEYESKDIKEVLAPVPSYEEWKESQKKRALWFDEKMKIENKLNKKIKLFKELLDDALKTMGQIARLSEDRVDAVQCANAICLIREKMEEIEEVK